MSITAQCQCGKTFVVKDEYAGKKGKCPKCGSIVVIPTPEVEEQAPDLDAVDWNAVNELESRGTPLPNQSRAVPMPPPMAPMAQASAAAGRTPCPSCQQMISARALRCEFCGAAFHQGFVQQPKMVNYQSNAGRGSYSGGSELSGLDWVIIILCPCIGIIMGIIRGASNKGWGMLGASIVSVIAWNILKLIIALATGSLQ